MFKINAVLGLLALSIAVTVPARADLLAGQTIEVTYLFPDTGTKSSPALQILSDQQVHFRISLVSRT